MSTSAKIATMLRRWREDPITMVREEFSAEPDEWQKEGLAAFPNHQRLAFKACKGPGKTTELAWFVWNFMATRLHPNIAVTSISGDNLKDGLWKELAKWYARSNYCKQMFDFQKTRIVARDHPDTWFTSARSWSRAADTTKQSDTLAGLHADYIMFVLDESGGIPDAVMATAEAGLATGIETKLVQAGNPTQLQGPLYRACSSERSLWKLIEITGDPDDPRRSPRISVQWAREQIQKYGKDNPWVLVNVFGKFPPSSINTLLGPDEVNEACRRHLTPDKYEFACRLIGVDVARFGDDRTVLFPRQGLAAFNPIIMRNARTTEIAARIVAGVGRWDADAVFIDDTGGWAAGVIDNVILTGHTIIPVQFAGDATDPRYYNKRAEIHFAAAQAVKRGAALPNVPELVEEASAPTYTFKDGKLLVEDKDQIKERIGRSPDLWDAYCCTYAVEMGPRPPRTGIPMIDGQRGKLASDWNPHEDRA